MELDGRDMCRAHLATCPCCRGAPYHVASSWKPWHLCKAENVRATAVRWCPAQRRADPQGFSGPICYASVNVLCLPSSKLCCPCPYGSHLKFHFPPTFLWSIRKDRGWTVLGFVIMCYSLCMRGVPVVKSSISSRISAGGLALYLIAPLLPFPNCPLALCGLPTAVSGALMASRLCARSRRPLLTWREARGLASTSGAPAEGVEEKHGIHIARKVRIPLHRESGDACLPGGGGRVSISIPLAIKSGRNAGLRLRPGYVRRSWVSCPRPRFRMQTTCVKSWTSVPPSSRLRVRSFARLQSRMLVCSTRRFDVDMTQKAAPDRACRTQGGCRGSVNLCCTHRRPRAARQSPCQPSPHSCPLPVPLTHQWSQSVYARCPILNSQRRPAHNGVPALL
jgi:hypothetical protein